jgi:hypothetical protein
LVGILPLLSPADSAQATLSLWGAKSPKKTPIQENDTRIRSEEIWRSFYIKISMEKIKEKLCFQRRESFDTISKKRENKMKKIKLYKE